MLVGTRNKKRSSVIVRNSLSIHVTESIMCGKIASIGKHIRSFVSCQIVNLDVETIKII
jgi:hypothetical protein